MLYLDQLVGKSQKLIRIAKQGIELTLLTTFAVEYYRNKIKGKKAVQIDCMSFTIFMI